METVKLNIHLIYCRACRNYTARNNRLSKLFKKATIRTMPQNDKAAIKERLRKEMRK